MPGSFSHGVGVGEGRGVKEGEEMERGRGMQCGLPDIQCFFLARWLAANTSDGICYLSLCPVAKFVRNKMCDWNLILRNKSLRNVIQQCPSLWSTLVNYLQHLIAVHNFNVYCLSRRTIWCSHPKGVGVSHVKKECQPRFQGPLSTSRKYPGYGWSRAYTCQLQTHRGWVLNKLQLQLQLSSPSLRSYLWNLLKSSRHVTSRNQGTFSR